MFHLTTLKRLCPRSGYDVVAVLAMCAALGTGGAYAYGELITGADIVDESLTGADVKYDSLTADDVAQQTLTSDDIADGSVYGVDVAAGTLGGSRITDGSLTGADVNESTLGKVPTAQSADTANSAPVKGLQRVTEYGGYATATDEYDQIATATTACPAGKKVIGAGGSSHVPPTGDYRSINTRRYLYVQAIEPSVDLTRVTVKVKLSYGDADTDGLSPDNLADFMAKAIAICADTP